MRKAFLQQLTSEGILSQKVQEHIRSLLRTAPEPIGTIAFSHGMITADDIDSIMAEQRRSHRPFGEIALEMGILTHTQVECLLGVQQMRAAADIAEALTLAGICTLEEIVPQLGRFLTQNQLVAAQVEEQP